MIDSTEWTPDDDRDYQLYRGQEDEWDEAGWWCSIEATAGEYARDTRRPVRPRLNMAEVAEVAAAMVG